MVKRFKQFFEKDSGAITVDWVVLTAAIVGLGIATIASIQAGAVAMGPAISAEIDRQMPQ